MKTPKAFLLALLFLSLCAATANGRSPRPVVTWEPSVDMDGQLFPSFIFATSTIRLDKVKQNQNPYYFGDRTGHVGITIVSPSADARIRVLVKLPNIAEPSIFDGILKEKGKEYSIFPNITYRYDALLAIKQPTPIPVTFTLYINGSRVGSKTRTIPVRSIDDCPFAFFDKHGKLAHVEWMYTAYVNENDPSIDELLRDEIASVGVDRFIGYQGTPEDVYRQVFTVWDALQRRSFRYSSQITPTGESSMVFSQYVRSFEDSIRTSQANCVDGSLMFASALRRIGIDCAIVLLPHHCFVGFYVDRAHTDLRYLETTAMASTDLSRYPDDSGIASELSHIFAQETRNQASWMSFIAALKLGAEEFNRNRDAFARHEAGFCLLEVDTFRKMGINPISR
jgi:hypothetical protein